MLRGLCSVQRFDEGNCHVARTKQKNICESYNLPKDSGQVEFMDTYVDRITGKLVVSIAAPYHNAAGAYRGAVCEDIFLDILGEEVKELKFQGEGTGDIFDNAGNIIATED